jgi:putative transposase
LPGTALALANGPNARWSLDFVSDCFSDGRRFRILAILDDFTPESLALIPDTSLSGVRVARELDVLITRRGRPKSCVSDNGTELTSKAIRKWSQTGGVNWLPDSGATWLRDPLARDIRHTRGGE